MVGRRRVYLHRLQYCQINRRLLQRVQCNGGNFSRGTSGLNSGFRYGLLLVFILIKTPAILRVRAVATAKARPIRPRVAVSDDDHRPDCLEGKAKRETGFGLRELTPGQRGQR